MSSANSSKKKNTSQTKRRLAVFWVVEWFLIEFNQMSWSIGLAPLLLFARDRSFFWMCLYVSFVYSIDVAVFFVLVKIRWCRHRSSRERIWNEHRKREYKLIHWIIWKLASNRKLNCTTQSSPNNSTETKSYQFYFVSIVQWAVSNFSDSRLIFLRLCSMLKIEFKFEYRSGARNYNSPVHNFKINWLNVLHAKSRMPHVYYSIACCTLYTHRSTIGNVASVAAMPYDCGGCCRFSTPKCSRWVLRLTHTSPIIIIRAWVVVPLNVHRRVTRIVWLWYCCALIVFIFAFDRQWKAPLHMCGMHQEQGTRRWKWRGGNRQYVVYSNSMFLIFFFCQKQTYSAFIVIIRIEWRPWAADARAHRP